MTRRNRSGSIADRSSSSPRSSDEIVASLRSSRIETQHPIVCKSKRLSALQAKRRSGLTNVAGRHAVSTLLRGNRLLCHGWNRVRNDFVNRRTRDRWLRCHHGLTRRADNGIDRCGAGDHLRLRNTIVIPHHGLLMHDALWSHANLRLRIISRRRPILRL